MRKLIIVAVLASFCGGMLGWGAEAWSLREAGAANWPVENAAAKAGPAVVAVVGLTVKTDPVQQLERPGVASGSGVVIRANGYLVTNYHVVKGMRRVMVVRNDGKAYAAKVVGSDPATDLAVVKIAATHLPVAQFVPAGAIRVGELAVAIGNPLGLGFQQSVTSGVISGLNRTLGPGYALRAYRLIQTDAAINPGNSGGALVDAEGRVLGINSVKIATPGVEGMGFAIPSPTVEGVVAEILRYGKVVRPWLGVGLIGPDGPAQLFLPKTGGLLVAKVYPATPAAKAGLAAGDMILAVNGRQMNKVADFLDYLGTLKTGDKVKVSYRRGKAESTINIQLAALPPGI